MTTYKIQRWDPVLFGNNVKPNPMFYIIPDLYFDEFARNNKYSLFCMVKNSASLYDNIVIPVTVNKSYNTPNNRPNFYNETQTYVITMDTPWMGYPKNLGLVKFFGYKLPIPQVLYSPGRVGPGRVGPGRVGPGRVGPGRVGPGRVGPGRVGPGRKHGFLGAPESHSCEDGTEFTCSGGTFGCYDNSDMYCSTKPGILGAPETHSCEDGTKFTCSGGTFGCYDNSDMYCSTKPGILGAPETHSCEDGTKFTCSGGTFGCYDNSDRFCPYLEDLKSNNNKPKPSTIPSASNNNTTMETHKCQDGKTFECSRGSVGCNDDSEKYCSVIKSHTCSNLDGKIFNCSSSKSDCKDDSSTYCGLSTDNTRSFTCPTGSSLNSGITFNCSKNLSDNLCETLFCK